ncbi:hypothetical protein ACHAWU_000641 [Discostella pseudostelligera]|uniref:Protein kinase domain-containing protein n=1 Tax=Discostella pseudostelligera TaxID=259834 RepID=A0ABD3MEZ9_9STRA
MTIRTPVSQIKKLKKGTKSSPPLGGVPLQSLRPSIQQARDPTLELFEPSPEQHSRSPLEVAVKPKYPRQELRSESSTETNRNRHLRAVTRRPLTTFGVFSCTVLSIASLHLLYFGHLSFEGMDLTSSNVSNKKAVTSDKHNYFRSNQNVHVKGPPRVICIGNHLDNTTPSFVAEAGRNVVLYPAEFSDVTQLYDRKDDDEIADSVEMKYFPMHETNEDCVPMSPWQTYSFPTCNNLHEMGLEPSLHDNTLKLLSTGGSWRDAWTYTSPVARPPNETPLTDNVIMKSLKLQHTFQDRYFEFSRVDALAMERLTSSPYIMGINGFCGVSVVTERGTDAFADVVDKLSSRSKVDVAIKVARSIADVHEIGGPNSTVSLVHNDININNIFMGPKNNPLLNDFNIAVLTMKDRNNNSTCSFPGHFPNPQWKSPEEQVGPDGKYISELTEKVDIYALGNLLFRFATNNGPWRDMAQTPGAKFTDEQKNQIAQFKITEGKMPNVPERILKMNDPYLNLLLEAMEWCYTYEPELRPTAREVADFLESSKLKLDADLVEFGRYPK